MVVIMLTSALHDVSSSRLFEQFQDTHQMARKIINDFEEYLTTLENLPTGAEADLEYSSEELFDFMDKCFGELVCLEQQGESELFIPLSVSWAKEAVYHYLKSICYIEPAAKLNQNCDPTNQQPSSVLTQSVLQATNNFAHI